MQAMEGMILALEDADIMLIELADYENILENGFDGQVKAKMSLLKSAQCMAHCLLRTELRPLAYAAKSEVLGMHGVLYDIGQTPAALYLVVEGTCKVCDQLCTSLNKLSCHEAVYGCSQSAANACLWRLKYQIILH